jgi:thiamine monophosphate synthase
MLSNNPKFYIFIKKIKEINNQTLKKFKDCAIIYNEKIITADNLIELQKIKNFCKKNYLRLFILNNFKLAHKIKAEGICLTSNNRSIKMGRLENKLMVIGCAHNQIEYFFKIKQFCKTIVFSPIFYNIKYSPHKILYLRKFNLITLNWKKEICPLGGINDSNFKLINLTKSKSIAFSSFVTNAKKPVYRLNKRVF